MANVCEVTGKRRLVGNTVSHANNKNKMRQHPNIQEKTFFVPELNNRIRLKVSSSGIRLIDKRGGLAQFVKGADPATLSPRLRKLRKALTKSRAAA